MPYYSIKPTLFLSYLLSVIIAAALFPSESIAQPPCGKLRSAGQFGPYDYTNHTPFQLRIVEDSHFTPPVERLETSNLIGDLDYTLRAFPNHHRALIAIAKYERNRNGKLPHRRGSKFPTTAECYFDRAIRFQPKDPAVRTIYGIHLHLTGKLDEALKQYKIAEGIQQNSADLQYNMGLLYFDQKEYALAKRYAKRAYQLGYPLSGLQRKLEKEGYWP